MHSCDLSREQHKHFCLPPIMVHDNLAAGGILIETVSQGLSSSLQGVQEIATVPTNAMPNNNIPGNNGARIQGEAGERKRRTKQLDWPVQYEKLLMAWIVYFRAIRLSQPKLRYPDRRVESESRKWPLRVS